MKCFYKVLVFCLLLLSPFAVVVPSVLGKACGTLIPLFGFPDDEMAAQGSVCIYIWQIADPYYTNYHPNPVVDMNAVLFAAGGMGETDSIALFIGHGSYDTIIDQWGVYEDQYYIVLSAGQGFAYDNNIYPSSASRNLHFAFLWSCYQGRTQGGYYRFSGYHSGMAYTWLHPGVLEVEPSPIYYADLSPDGYGQPDNKKYTFIGWWGPAPFITLNVGGVPQAGYYFLINFYHALIAHGVSIKGALDYAALNVFSTGWQSCIFKTGWDTGEGEFTCMKVYGDGNYVPNPDATNHPPDVPPFPPSGPNSGKTKNTYTYQIKTTDPELDSVYYQFYWGDGTYSAWIGPYDSDQWASASHSWSACRTYFVSVRAKDSHGATSDWSSSLAVSMSCR